MQKLRKLLHRVDRVAYREADDLEEREMEKVQALRALLFLRILPIRK